MNYTEAEKQVDLSHLQDTVYLVEMYNIVCNWTETQILLGWVH
jgi:hypothetical protein